MEFDTVDLPYRGEVTWLTAEEGGRASGPPRTSQTYATVAHIPPADPATGCASFVLRGWDPDAIRSSASAGWLFGDRVPQAAEVVPGTVIAITDGVRFVAHFTVKSVESSGR